jgi:uncharacterized protein involved in exopolysaccharide biosynthesis
MARRTLGDADDTRVDAGGEEDEGLDLAKIKAILGFFLRAPRRHPRFAAAVGASVLFLSVLLAAVLPRTYTAEVRILAQRNVVLPTVEGSLPTEEPTKGVVDEIMKRDSIVALVKGLDLVKRWDATRMPALRLKDLVLGLFHGPLTEDQKVRALVGILEERIAVTAETDSFKVAVEWPDPQAAYDLANAAYTNFLDSRYEMEVGIFTERLRILEMRAQLAAQDVDESITGLSKIEKEKKQAGTAVVAAGATGLALFQNRANVTH